MTQDDSLQIAVEVLNVNDMWFDTDDIETTSGADVTSLTVARDGVTIHAHEKFGDGQQPYARDPSHHIEMLNHDTYQHGEGVVTYPEGDTNDEYPLDLPKHLYFTEERSFDEPVETVDDLETAVSNALDIEFTLGSIVASIDE